VAKRYVEALRKLIAHCLSPEAGGYTPSDFQLARVTQADIDRIIGHTRDVEDLYPLTPMQEGILYHTLHGNPDVYFEQLSCTIEGEFDVRSFERAWAKVVERHAALRTSFVLYGSMPALQMVRKHVEISWDRHDLRGATNQQKVIEEYLAEDRKRGFDLAKAPLMRLAMIQLSENTWQFVWSFHHLLLDGWCVGLVISEIFELYEAYRQGRPVNLLKPRPFRDYIAWLATQDIPQAEFFWRKQLAGLTDGTVATRRRMRLNPAKTDRIYDERRVALALGTVQSLTACARKHHLTLNTIVQGAWALLLSRYSGGSDVIFGVTSSGRPTALSGVESMVGLFVNTLPVRLSVTPHDELIPWLDRIQRLQAEIRQYEYAPLVSIQRWSDVPPGLPLFDSMFAFENYPVADALRSGGGPFKLRNPRVFEKTDYPITILASATSGVVIRALYDCNYFDEAAVDRLLGHLRTLIEEIAQNPLRPLAELPALTAAEHSQICLEWNATQRDYRKDLTVPDLIERQAQRTPNAVAVVFGRQQLTYRQLDERSSQLARYLRRLSVGPEARVGICLERCLDLVVAVIATQKAGGAYVPLDPTYPKQRLKTMLRDAQVSVLVTQERLLSSLPEHDVTIVRLDTEWSTISRESREKPASNITGDNLLYIIFTSGSTGSPKGAGVIQRNFVNVLEGMSSQFPIGPGDKVLVTTSFSFDLTQKGFFFPLMRGAEVHLWEGQRYDPFRIVEAVAQSGITILNSTPGAFYSLVEQNLREAAEKLRSLRYVFFGGESLVIARLWPWLSSEQCRAEMVNTYGPTECADICTVLPISDPAQFVDSPPPIGKPVANLRLYPLAPDLTLCPVGMAGEIYIGGDGVCRGYVNDAELTALKFIPNPFAVSPGERIYRTGDLARWLPDGNLEFLGRVDHQVKLRGFRIELGEIESVLRQHAKVQDAVALIREDAPGDRRLVTYIVPDPAPSLGEQEWPIQELTSERVSQWQTVFDESYSGSSVANDPTFNIAGWNSVYTGEPIPAEEMREWVDETVETIAALTPDRILEIGCGTGLLLFRLAPRCSAYWGADTSRTALELLETTVKQLGPEFVHVRLFHSAAHQIFDLEPSGFDVIVLNSVIQYFPRVEYLLEVLEHALKALRPGGSIFIGDVRSLPLAEAHYASVQLYKASNSVRRSELSRRVQFELSREQELLVDPAFFISLQQHLPGIGQVEVFQKRGPSGNELTKFRYQVVIRKQEAARPDIPDDNVEWWDWNEKALTLTTLREALLAHRPQPLGLTHIPNARLDRERKLLELLNAESGFETVADIREALRAAAGDGIDTEELSALAAESSYSVTFSWANHGTDGSFDAIFRKELEDGRSRQYPFQLPNAGSTARPWRAYTNDPMRIYMARKLVPALRTYLAEKLPDYMAPSAFVMMDRFPLTVNGKIDRRNLPPPEGERPELKQAYAAPRTPVEGLLADIWSQALRVEQVGIHDNFLELGGDSILSIQVVARARQAGLKLTPRQMFQYPTVAELAAVALCETEVGSEPGAPASDRQWLLELHGTDLESVIGHQGEIEDIYPLSPMQEGMLFHSIYTSDSALYIVQFDCALPDSLDIKAFQKAWEEVARRHPMLRTEFFWKRAGQPAQVVRKRVDLPWEMQDWRGVSLDEQRRRLNELRAREREQGFDLSSAPLMRFVLLRLADEAYHFLWSHHHLLLDGWSLPLLINDLIECYDAYREGRGPRLGQVCPYRDYIAWLQRQDLAQAEAYWRETLKGFTTATPLPLAKPVSDANSARPVQQSMFCSLSASATSQLNVWCRERRVTLNTLVQSIWALLLSHYSSATDVLFGAVVSGRPASLPGIETIIGLFINTLPVRVRVPANLPLAIWMQERLAQQIEQRQYEYSPLARVKSWSEAPSHLPLFDSLLVFENYPSAISNPSISGLRVSDARYHIAESHPLVLAVGPRDELNFEIKYDARRFDSSRIGQLAGNLRALLEAIIEGVSNVEDLRNLLVARDRAARAHEAAAVEQANFEALRATRRKRIVVPPVTDKRRP